MKAKNDYNQIFSFARIDVTKASFFFAVHNRTYIIISCVDVD